MRNEDYELYIQDVLDEDMPELPEEEMRDEDGMLDMYNPLKNLEVIQYCGFIKIYVALIFMVFKVRLTHKIKNQ